MEFIKVHWLELLIVVLFFIATIIYVAWQIKKKGLRQTAIDFIVEAEKIYDSESGQTKKEYVIKRIYDIVPPIFKIFVTEENIDRLVQKIFDEIKKALDYVPEKEEK